MDMKYKAGDELYYGNDRVDIRDTIENGWVPVSELDNHLPQYQIVLPGQGSIYEYDRDTRWVYEGELHELPLWERLARIEKVLGLG